MTKRLLLVEDDPDLGQLLAQCLRDRGYDVVLAAGASDALDAVRMRLPALCIFDVELPEQDGFSLAESIKTEVGNVPFFFLTARSRQDDRIRGLRLGANDYVSKPFQLEELLLRIGNFLQTSASEKMAEVQIGKLRLDVDRLLLKSADQSISLTLRECRVLEMLARDLGRVVRRDHIMRNVWGRADYFTGRSLDVFISRLRKHVALDPELHILTVRSVGFVLERK